MVETFGSQMKLMQFSSAKLNSTIVIHSLPSSVSLFSLSLCCSLPKSVIGSSHLQLLIPKASLPAMSGACFSPGASHATGPCCIIPLQYIIYGPSLVPVSPSNVNYSIAGLGIPSSGISTTVSLGYMKSWAITCHYCL